jgi:LAO/AO transport system kinase
VISEAARDLLDRFLRGDVRALSRLMTAAENGRGEIREILRMVYPRTGGAHVIGITGPPGSGKSTLTMQVAAEYRRREKTVGIVAVDPTSPFTGGAILGDRIRMMELHTDPNVFVRSMATRGSLGGLARGTLDVVNLLDAFGKDIVLIETVGVGQDEVDIVRAAETILVVGVPGAGDDIQAIKAGILEIADVFVVNKADMPLADQLVKELRAMLQLAPPQAWERPILQTVASQASGIADLVNAIDAHEGYLHQSGARSTRRQDAARRQIQAIVEERLRDQVNELTQRNGWSERVEAVANRNQDPYSAADDLIAKLVSNH